MVRQGAQALLARDLTPEDAVSPVERVVRGREVVKGAVPLERNRQAGDESQPEERQIEVQVGPGAPEEIRDRNANSSQHQDPTRGCPSHSSTLEGFFVSG